MKKHYPKTERIYTPLSSLSSYAADIANFGDKVAYRYFGKGRIEKSLTYAELSGLMLTAAAGFDALGLSGKKIAVIGETSPEWVISYVGAISCGAIAIPLDRELDISEIEGFLSFGEVDAIVFSPSFYEKFAHMIDSHPTVKTFIPMEKPVDIQTPPCVIGFDEMLSLGRKNLEGGYACPEKSDESYAKKPSVFLFTSGTTGSSKCVMLSEKNVCSAVNAALESVNFSIKDRIVSVLPLHHTYELCIMLAALDYGIEICINDSLRRVLKNFEYFKPTGLILVPLFVNTIYKKIWDEAKKTGKTRALAFAFGLSKVTRAIGIDARKKIFSSVRSAFGGNIEKIICGGAPLNPELCDRFEAMGILICQGYGITECSPLISVDHYYAPKKGSVGPAVPCCEVRIDAQAKDDEGHEIGEIQVKGDNVMLGYYKNPSETAKVFTPDGYFKTGDVGYTDEDGYIYITGRKKYVIVLENGKNVFPEEIEEYLSEVEGIAECVVVGRKAKSAGEIEGDKASDGGEITLTAIIYPDFAKFETRNIGEIKAILHDRIGEMSRAKNLVSYKQIRAIEIREEEFEKTTSRKIKRHLVK